MFCKKCGKEIESDMRFCKNCGAPTEVTEKSTNSINGTDFRNIVPGIRIGVILAGLLLALSTILPYVVFDSEIARLSGTKSISLLLTDGEQIGDGIFYILLALIIIVFACIRKKTPILICSILSSLLCLFESIHFKKQYTEMLRGTKIDIWDYMKKGSGYYLLTLSVILLLVLGILYFIWNKKEVKK